MQYSIKAIALAIITLSVLLPGSFSIPCQDDPGYTFGFTGNAPGERRTCEWLSRLKVVDSAAALRFCEMTFLHNIVQDKCQVTCNRCDNPEIPGCIDKVILTDSGNAIDWHDRTGTEYDCVYYSWGDNCFIFGKAFHNQGMAAEDACCTCGGGNLPFR